ncbi:MAG: c-type cytochrome [Steroidobacteraceae bacterium]
MKWPWLVPWVILLAACAREPAEGPGRGRAVYATHCAACHQGQGQGLGDVQPALAGSVTVNGDPGALVAWVMYGDRPSTLQKRRGLAVMPQFFWLADEDLAAVLTYTRQSFGNAAEAIEPTLVTGVREDRGRP